MSRLYRKRVSTYWWLGPWPYLRFILREASSVPVAWFVVVTLRQLRALAAGREAYAEFQQWMSQPPMVALNAVCFVFVLFHTITWFNLTPRAVVLRLRGQRVPDHLIAAPNYLGWVAASAAVAWLILRA